MFTEEKAALPMPDALFESLRDLERATKRLADIADNIQKGDLRRELGRLVAHIVSSIDFELTPILRKEWPGQPYLPLD
jgi:hypothetical protein